MAAAASLPHDHNPDWVRELGRVAATSPSLPDAAVQAVLTALDAFQAEDGPLPQPASNVQAALAAALEEPSTGRSPSTLGETLHAALRLRVRRQPPPAQAHAA